MEIPSQKEKKIRWVQKYGKMNEHMRKGNGKRKQKSTSSPSEKAEAAFYIFKDYLILS